jgi:hypothetical protein
MAKFYPTTYQLDAPVGPNKSNQPVDVKVVQAMFMNLKRAAPNDTAGLPALQESGQFSSDLEAWIRWFQQHEGAGRLVVDGIIHPMRMGQHKDLRSTFASGVGSTLHFLNGYSAKNAPLEHQAIAGRLRLQLIF